MPDLFKNLFEFDMQDLVPRAPEIGSDDKETINNLVDYCERLSIAFGEFMMLASKYVNADGIVNIINDNSNIEIDADSIDLSTMVYRSAGNQVPSHKVGRLWYVTDTAGEPTYVKGRIYRSNGSAWETYDDSLYSTTITAGQISITELTNRSLANVDSAADTKLGGIAAGADVTSGALYQTLITAGRINLSSSVFDGALNYSTYVTEGPPTNADSTAANPQPSSWLSTNIAAGSVDITIGGSGTALDDMIKDQTDWSNDNASGLYMTTQYLGFWNTTTNVWDVRIDNTGNFYFGGDASNYIEWNGAVLEVRGSLVAEDVLISGSTTLDNWVTGTTKIDGGEIHTNTIVASSLNISNLADVATLIAGSVTVGNATNSGTITLYGADTHGDAVIKSNGAAFGLGVGNEGFILGFDDTDNEYKLEIGNSAGNFLKWNGTTLTVNGSITTTDLTSGVIDDGAVGTSKLSSNAVINVQGMTQATRYYPAEFGSPPATTLGSVEITLTESDSEVIVQGYWNVENVSTTDWKYIYIYVYRDAVLLYGGVRTDIRFNKYATIPIFYLDSPGASGLKTYTVQAMSETANKIYTGVGAFSVTEIKR